MAPSPAGDLYGLIDAQRLKIRTLPPGGNPGQRGSLLWPVYHCICLFLSV